MMLSDLLIARIKPLIKMLLSNFLTKTGIAIGDTAEQVIRQKKTTLLISFLQIVTPADIEKTLKQLPWCHAFITTGKKKATEVLCQQFTNQKNTKHWRASTAIDCQPSH